jgi:peptide/nickel transport system substrate-binding protein
LNIAKSCVRPAICNRVRIDQTCFGRSGGFWPISLPSFQRQDFTVGLSVTEAGVDDPDQQFYENYVCGAERNYTGYCSPEVDKLIDQQSMEPDQDKRKKLVWEIERRLAEDGARPVIFYPRGGTCRQPWGKGLTIMVNSIYNGWRYEDVWLDK